MKPLVLAVDVSASMIDILCADISFLDISGVAEWVCTHFGHRSMRIYTFDTRTYDHGEFSRLSLLVRPRLLIPYKARGGTHFGQLYERICKAYRETDIVVVGDGFWDQVPKRKAYPIHLLVPGEAYRECFAQEGPYVSVQQIPNIMEL